MKRSILAATACIALAACNSEADTSADAAAGAPEEEVAEFIPYPDEVKTAFIDSCTQSGAPEATCTCTFTEIESYLTIEEYVEFESRMILNQTTEDDVSLMSEVRAACIGAASAK